MFLLPRPHQILKPHCFCHYYDVMSLLTARYVMRMNHGGILIVTALICIALVDVYLISRSRSKLQDDHHQLHGVLPIAEKDNYSGAR